ncbi:MAG: type II toxin-antitoxin system VapC family toxin [Betaproteobacteria bacterium]|nr:type II toxin-antitoxin system VapC family toxin [Betaproteobacteria bacterium]
MLGIDTNVLVRYLVRDDEAQFEIANRLIRRGVGAGEAIFVSLPVLLETEWVLRSRYALNKLEVAETISQLLDTTEIQFEDEAAIEECLRDWKDSTASFADCLIGAHNRRQGCRATATFDVKAGKLSTFIQL